MVVGHDFRFGFRGEADVEMLRAAAPCASARTATPTEPIACNMRPGPFGRRAMLSATSVTIDTGESTGPSVRSPR